MMRKITLINLGLLFLIASVQLGPIKVLHSQEFINIVGNNWAMPEMNRIKPTITDIDNNGLLDMVVGDYDGYLKHYEQTFIGSDGFKYINSSLSGIFVGQLAAPSFADIDNDGLLDLIVGKSDGKLRHFEQVSQNSKTFSLVSSSFNSIDIGESSVPCFTDIDNDGRLDLCVGNNFGQLSRYEQAALNSEIFVPALIQNIDVGSQCTQTFADIDNDGLLDLILGAYDGLLRHYEQSSSGSHVFNNLWGFNNLGFGNESAPVFTDLNNDGLLDLIVGNYYGSLYHYKQDSPGSTTFSSFPSTFSSLDIGGSSSPVFTDLDDDGLFDLIIGESSGNLNHYEQESVSSLDFNLVSESFAGISVSSSTPTFIDIDNDGLLDLIVGEHAGNLNHYEQSSFGSDVFNFITPTFNNIDVGSISTPVFIDLDNNGLLDMLIGEFSGNLYHYEQASINSETFNLVSNSFNGISIGSYSAPCITDLNNNGLLDLIIGESDGYLNHYEQESVGSLIFNLITANFNGIDVGNTSRPSFADINNDGLQDLVVGSNLGNLFLYLQYIPPTTCTSPISPLNEAVDISVNPSLNWNSVPEADSYLLNFGTDNPPTNIANELDLGNITTYNPGTSLDYYQTYYWQVVPYNSNDTAQGCEVWSFTTERRVNLSITTFLEGPYNGTDMNTDLNPEPIPIAQPYNNPSKWNYQGTESVTAIPNADVVDWVLVELRETSGDASTALPDSMIAQQAAFILKDASIVGLDGTNPLYFDNEITDNLYVVVYHRNHLPIMSSGPLTAAKGDYSWDFTTAMSQAYGTDAQVDLGGGVFGMIGGDGDADGLVKVHDIDTVWSYEAGNSGYLSGDFSLDKQTDNIDKNDIWNLNDLQISQVPGYICTPQPDYADAGQDQLGNCDWMEIYLNANTPINGTGTWTIESGTWGNIDDIHNPHTPFWGSLGQSYNLKWTISNDCGENYDFVVIAYEQLPGQTDAGPDQLNIPGTSTILQANNVEWAFWEIVSGEGGSFENSSDPNTIFYGIEGNTYELKWQVILACDWSEDFVTISFAEPTWSCGEPIIDERDGQSYNTVQIGIQCWMAENLNIGIMINGSGNQTDNGTIEKYCYDNSSANCNIYGGLYQWDEMMQYVTTEGTQGICPLGWHLPTDTEWCTLEDYVDSGIIDCNEIGWKGVNAGGSLKEAGENHWTSPNTGATNLSGFTCLPGGSRYTNSLFYDINIVARLWSSNTDGSSAFGHAMAYDKAQVHKGGGYNRDYGFSVRCVQEVEIINQPPAQPFNPLPQNNSVNIFIDTILSWSCSDPDEDDLTYNIYFGTNPNPPLVQLNHADTFYNPGELLFDNIYYWKIVAYDVPGDSTAGEIWNFSTLEITSWTCGDPLIDDRDGKSYNTVQIGTQCWMAENLNIGTRIDGINDQTNNAVIEKYCYNDIEDSCSVFGGFYQWDEMMGYTNVGGTQGICAVGWHLPTDEEWKQLEGEVDSQYGYPDPEWDGIYDRGFDAGVNMRSTYGWEYFGFNHTDPYGFTVLASGFRSTNGSFYNWSYDTRYWSSTEIGSLAWGRYIVFDFGGVSRNNVNKAYGSSIRCLKN